MVDDPIFSSNLGELLLQVQSELTMGSTLIINILLLLHMSACVYAYALVKTSLYERQTQSAKTIP